MALAFSPASRARIDDLLGRYPSKQAACLPVLQLAQEEFGTLSVEAVALVAETLELPRAIVWGVATFYSLLNTEPVGTYHVQVCTNVSCMLCGSAELLSRMEQKLGIRAGETTTDGLFSLSEVECLAHCGSGPAVQINDEIHELVSPDRGDELLDELKAKAESPGP